MSLDYIYSNEKDMSLSDALRIHHIKCESQCIKQGQYGFVIKDDLFFEPTQIKLNSAESTFIIYGEKGLISKIYQKINDQYSW
jgi:hypothetical protein